MSIHLSRRGFLGTTVALGCGALVGCTISDPMTGSFLQPWQSHLDWTREQWQSRLQDMHALGCRELFLQWVGIDNADPAKTWSLPEAQITRLLDLSQELGMGVHLGLTYDERWWTLLGQTDLGQTQTALNQISARAVQYMQAASWPRHAAFRGWYIPYELEQYHWADPARIQVLASALQPMALAAQATSGQPPTLSTYFSTLETTGRLETLWGLLLDQVALHPMIQDGVGVAGMRNYDALAPLQRLLQQRQAPFDLVVELFEQLPSSPPDGTDFKARSASFARLQKQWKKAKYYGAQRIVAFALDPWVLGESDEAQQLRKDWLQALQ